eukprot:s127_g18.t1
MGKLIMELDWIGGILFSDKPNLNLDTLDVPWLTCCDTKNPSQRAEITVQPCSADFEWHSQGEDATDRTGMQHVTLKA